MAMGFTRQNGGDTVRYGFYWNLREWEAQIVPREGGVLAGAGTVQYLRLPLLALLVIAPLMGAAYAFFLPFIGFAMVLMFLAGKLRGLFTTPPAVDGTVGTGDPKIMDRAHGHAAKEDHKRAA